MSHGIATLKLLNAVGNYRWDHIVVMGRQLHKIWILFFIYINN